MKFSVIVLSIFGLYIWWLKSPLAATTYSSLDLKRLQALLVAYLGMLLKTSMMVVIRDCFFYVRESVNTSPRDATL
jgi:hypothetical protein